MTTRVSLTGMEESGGERRSRRRVWMIAMQAGGWRGQSRGGDAAGMDCCMGPVLGGSLLHLFWLHTHIVWTRAVLWTTIQTTAPMFCTERVSSRQCEWRSECVCIWNPESSIDAFHSWPEPHIVNLTKTNTILCTYRRYPKLLANATHMSI